MYYLLKLLYYFGVLLAAPLLIFSILSNIWNNWKPTLCHSVLPQAKCPQHGRQMARGSLLAKHLVYTMMRARASSPHPGYLIWECSLADQKRGVIMYPASSWTKPAPTYPTSPTLPLFTSLLLLYFHLLFSLLLFLVYSTPPLLPPSPHPSNTHVFHLLHLPLLLIPFLICVYLLMPLPPSSLPPSVYLLLPPLPPSPPSTPPTLASLSPSPTYS